MTAFLDAYGTPTLIEPDDGISVVNLTVTNVAEAGAGLWLTGSVVLTLAADTDAVTVALKRTAPEVSFLQELTFTLPAVVTDPYTVSFLVDGRDGPGLVGEVTYALVVTPANASDDTSVVASALHARYNDPYVSPTLS